MVKIFGEMRNLSFLYQQEKGGDEGGEDGVAQFLENKKAGGHSQFGEHRERLQDGGNSAKTYCERRKDCRKMKVWQGGKVKATFCYLNAPLTQKPNILWQKGQKWRETLDDYEKDCDYATHRKYGKGGT